MRKFIKESVVVAYHGVELVFYLILSMFWILLIVSALMIPAVLMVVGLFAAINYYLI